MTRTLDCNGRALDLSRPQVMGVLNVTPDSFSDGGEHADRDAAVAAARRMVNEGAAIIDVGGESTRPGADPVPESEERRRVVPVIEALADQLDVPISIDSMKPGVMRAAVEAGAGLINDVHALRTEGALAAVAELEVPVCLMHMQGEPQTMQKHPVYDDVVGEVCRFLADRVAACEAAGIPRERILLDPGIGFGKTAEHNLTLLKALPRLAEEGLPVLVGASRKSLMQHVLGRALPDRLPGSLAVAALAAWQGAALIRAHDVQPTADAIRMAHAILHADA